MDQIKVFAPATVANVACGFDVMGFALEHIGDELTINRTDTPGFTITEITGCDGLPFQPDKNVATVAAQALLNATDHNQETGFSFKICKKVMGGSGLGSSASSSSAAVYAMNELLGKPFTKQQLVAFAMEGERAASGLPHADNVAPSILGGFALVRSYDPLDVIELDYPSELKVAVVHPLIEVKTSDSKKILRREVSLKDAIIQWGNVGGLVAGLAKPDFDLIGRSLQDVIAEPIRSMLIPLFNDAKSMALESGALGCSISGSGPSIFALCNDEETAQNIGTQFKDLYTSHDIKANVYLSGINPRGTEIIE
ncbi:MAG: homoserine kinase [Balneola sp.]|nr:MAG: homoserine kinase [Balneola sp.]